MELFIVGSLSFWALLAVEFIVLLALTEFEKPFWGVVSAISTVLLLHFIGGVPVLDSVVKYPGQTAAAIFGYFVIGTVWAVLKWFFFVRVKREEYLAAKEAYSKTPENKMFRSVIHGEVDMVARPWEESDIRCRFLNAQGGLVPLAREHKARILMWMAYWPWSAVWTLINDSVKRVYKIIYENIHKLLQSIAEAAFKDVT